jgi:hypothetical protein
MNVKTHRIGTVATLVAAAGVLGGTAGTWLASPHGAQAQTSTLSGSQITLTDASGRPRLTIAMTPDNQPSLTLADQNGITRASLGLARDGSAVMQSYDAAGNPVTSVLP